MRQCGKFADIVAAECQWICAFLWKIPKRGSDHSKHVQYLVLDGLIMVATIRPTCLLPSSIPMHKCLVVEELHGTSDDSAFFKGIIRLTACWLAASLQCEAFLIY